MSAKLIIVPCPLTGVSFCSKLKYSIFTWTIVGNSSAVLKHDYLDHCLSKRYRA